MHAELESREIVAVVVVGDLRCGSANVSLLVSLSLPPPPSSSHPPFRKLTKLRRRINAFVLPSTDIFVNSGLLEVVGDDADLLAAVLAHEICHVTERHSVESLGFLALSGVLFDVLRGASWALTLSFPAVGDGIAFLFTFLDKKVGTRAYSRKLETEADALGLEVRSSSYRGSKRSVH